MKFSGIIPVSYLSDCISRACVKVFEFSPFQAQKMADHKVDDGLKKEIEAGKTLKDTPVPETGVNTHDATLAGQKQHPVFSI